jgi:ABC-type molybdate transport system substrate-binding protein
MAIIGTTPLRSTIPRAAAAVIVLIGSQGLLNAGDLRLLSAASIQQVFKEILGDFEQASGHRIVLQYATMGAITDRIRSGEQADLVISSRQSIATLVGGGATRPSCR